VQEHLVVELLQEHLVFALCREMCLSTQCCMVQELLVLRCMVLLGLAKPYIHNVYTAFFQGIHQIYGHVRCIYICTVYISVRCIYMALANPRCHVNICHFVRNISSTSSCTVNLLVPIKQLHC
jgi:hypothetical protein